MFKSITIKIKLLTIIVGSIIVASTIIIAGSIISIEESSNSTIKEYRSDYKVVLIDTI